MGLLLIVGGLVSHARSAWITAEVEEMRRQRDAAKQQVREQRAAFEKHLKDYRESLLHYELHSLLHLVASAVSASDRATRAQAARTARQTIVCAAAKLVGESEANGTRANLFRFNRPQNGGKPDDEAIMTLEPGATAGRGSPSERKFVRGDTTTERTLKNAAQFVDCADDDSVPYATYATHPVSVGSEHIHGALTVDSLTPGVLEEKVDLPMMAVLSDLIAITYECEKYPKPYDAKRP
ncbi:hypothetical protein D1O33_03390 [Rhodococcus rhodochrous]|nr:hypothetical protein D1O33_03390 [Rhodococcus rhodochrous]